MYPTFSVLLGVLTKVFDDVVDRGLPVEGIALHSLQTVIVLLFALIAYQDVYFSYACLLVVVINSGFDHPFWNSFLPLTLILFLVSLPWRGSLFPVKLILCTLGVLAILVVAYYEDKYFPEEYSLRKIVSRVIASGIFLSGLWIIPRLPLPLPRFSVAPIEKTIYIMVAYLSTSIAFQTYDLVTVTATGAAEEEAVRGRATRGRAERGAAEAEEGAAGADGAPKADSQARRSC